MVPCKKRQELGRANLLQYYDPNRILRYIVESALAANDFTKPLGMRVAPDDNIPQATSKSTLNKTPQYWRTKTGTQIHYRRLVVGGWKTSDS